MILDILYDVVSSIDNAARAISSKLEVVCRATFPSTSPIGHAFCDLLFSPVKGKVMRHDEARTPSKAEAKPQSKAWTSQKGDVSASAKHTSSDDVLNQYYSCTVNLLKEDKPASQSPFCVEVLKVFDTKKTYTPKNAMCTRLKANVALGEGVSNQPLYKSWESTCVKQYTQNGGKENTPEELKAGVLINLMLLRGCGVKISDIPAKPSTEVLTSSSFVEAMKPVEAIMTGGEPALQGACGSGEL